MTSAEMLVFSPMFALAAFVTVGWVFNEVQRLRSRAWLTPVRFATPQKLSEAVAPVVPKQVVSNAALSNAAVSTAPSNKVTTNEVVSKEELECLAA